MLSTELMSFISFGMVNGCILTGITLCVNHTIAINSSFEKRKRKKPQIIYAQSKNKISRRALRSMYEDVWVCGPLTVYPRLLHFGKSEYMALYWIRVVSPNSGRPRNFVRIWKWLFLSFSPRRTISPVWTDLSDLSRGNAYERCKNGGKKTL